MWHSIIKTRVVFAGQSLLALEWLCARGDIELLRAFVPPAARARAALASCCAHAGVPLTWAASGEEVARAFPPAVDLGLCATFERLPAALLAAPRLGWLNLHPAPLPARPGRLPTVEGVLAGDRSWAGSLHWMSARLDAGDLVEERPCPVSWRDGPAELEVKGTLAALAALAAHWDGLMEGYAPRAPQPQPARAHVSPRLRESLSPREPAARAWRRLKACAPFGGVPMRSEGLWVLLCGGLLEAPASLEPAPDSAPAPDSELTSALWATALSAEERARHRDPLSGDPLDLRVHLVGGAALLCGARCAPAPPPGEARALPPEGAWGPWRPLAPAPLAPLSAEEALLFPFEPPLSAPLSAP